MKYGYIRTNKSEEFKNAEIERMRKEEVDEIIIENDGEELNRLLEKLQPNDSLYVYDISRLSSKVATAKETIKILIDKNIALFTYEGKVKLKNVGYAIGVIQDLKELESMEDAIEATKMKVYYELDRDFAKNMSERIKENQKERIKKGMEFSRIKKGQE